ncbi:hypothetical protein [Nocardia puris]|uniref:hypothetical protein n=1 Tax=Nocardia puris TaxID=208602 RepID=UPI00082B93E7|nr:hypothetical protein [Nocardia puris]
MTYQATGAAALIALFTIVLLALAIWRLPTAVLVVLGWIACAVQLAAAAWVWHLGDSTAALLAAGVAALIALPLIRTTPRVHLHARAARPPRRRRAPLLRDS